MRNCLAVVFMMHAPLVLSLASCSAPQVPPLVSTLTLTQVEKIQVGQTTRDQALKIFGAPDMRPEIPEFQGRKEAWLYLNPASKNTRLSLIFEKQSGRLESINWFVNPGDPEANIEYVKRRYQPLQLEKREPKWTSPDAGPSQVFFVDQKTGLKIAVGKLDNIVEAIIWNRTLSENVAAK